MYLVRAITLAYKLQVVAGRCIIIVRGELGVVMLEFKRKDTSHKEPGIRT